MQAGGKMTARNVNAWKEYRAAFDDFAKKAQQVQILAALPSVDQQAIDRALFEMETAHAVYNQRRDALAAEYLPSTTATTPADVNIDDNSVKNLAALRWEISGRPDGTAEDDWYRAEEIVNLARPASA